MKKIYHDQFKLPGKGEGEGIKNQSQMHTDGKNACSHPQYNPIYYINHNANKSAYIMELWNFVSKNNNNKNKQLGIIGAHGIM